MRVLLDESVPRRLASMISGHDVATVVGQGWAGMSNGELLAKAASDFDVFVTVDKNLPHQQDLQRFSVAIVILDAKTNRLHDLRPIVPKLLEALADLPPSPVVLTAATP